jgi:hypothetical protein
MRLQKVILLLAWVILLENNMLDAKVKNLILQTDEQDDLQSKLNEQKLAIS